MKVLIIGLGYAGQRYLRAFHHIAQTTAIPIDIAYVGRHRKPVELPYYPNVHSALEGFAPEVVVVSATDLNHAHLLHELRGYLGFVICEKPLVTPNDSLDSLADDLIGLSGFALDLVERYSAASWQLREWVSEHQWQLVRATFHWGKDRINDYRPTCGVTSEVIHALDLLGWICPQAGPMELHGVLGGRSDFSISGSQVLDTVLLTANMGEAQVIGYSSFVNIVRQRTIDFSFVDREGQLFHARLVFDTPRWDMDQLRIWTRRPDGSVQVLHELATDSASTDLETIYKLSELCRHVVHWVQFKQPPPIPFAGLPEALCLQRLLNALEQRALVLAPTRYIRTSHRQLLADSADLELLG